MIVVLVVIVCAVRADANIHNFVSMLNEHLKNNFYTTWNFIKNAIKRPVRVKKLRHEIIVIPTSTQLPDLPELEDILLTMTTTATTVIVPNTVPANMMYYFQRPKHKQVLLPIIVKPTWRTRDDWLNLQQLNFFVRRGVHGIRERVRSTERFAVKDPPDGDELAVPELDDDPEDRSDDEIGVMMFV